MPRPTSLSDFTGECKPSGHNINYKHCPVCGSDEWKLYLDPTTGLYKCFAGRHNSGGKVDIGQASNPYTQGQELMDLLDGWKEPVTWEEIELPRWHLLTKMAKRYLRRRGVSEETARKLGLVEWVDKFRILIPYFDRAGNLVYWNSRRYSNDIGQGPKYLTAPGKHPLYEADWREEQVYTAARMPGIRRGMAALVHAMSAPTVLVEGVFDAWAVAQAGYHTIALGGKSLPAYLKSELLTSTAGCDMIVVMLDSDALASAYRIRDQLSDRRVVHIVPCPQGKDPGDMSPDEIRSLI